MGVHRPTLQAALAGGSHYQLAISDWHALYTDRWLIKQLSLAGKHMVGVHGEFVFAAETRQRLPQRFCQNAWVTDYLPKGILAHRR